MFSSLTNKIIKIESQQVLEYARGYDLEVQTIEDFRKLATRYERIEELMDDYRSSFARTSMLGGLTTGIGGFTTSVTFASLDTALLALQLYRLAQRFAILNGFDGNEPLQREKMMNIYFESMSLNAIAQATLKYQFIQASKLAGSGIASKSLVLKAIMKTGKALGNRISPKKAGRLAPVVGGAVGAAASYSFARKISRSMKKEFKKAYFDTWQ